MPLMPKRVKYRKHQRGSRKGFESRAVSVDFPDVLEVKIADTGPALHQQQTSNFKAAKLENGVEIMVPLFVKTGDMIRLDLQNLRYMDRAKARHQ